MNINQLRKNSKNVTISYSVPRLKHRINSKITQNE